MYPCHYTTFLATEPPGKIKDLKVTSSSYNTLCLAWSKPNVVKGVEDEVKGYFVEIRPTDQMEWSRCNTNSIVQTSFTITGLKPLATYWVRVIAINEGGEGEPQGFNSYITAMPPPGRCKSYSTFLVETVPYFAVTFNLILQ